MSRRDLLSGPGVALPPNKDHHYFLSHKKEHSLSGRVPEQVAKNFHDGLEMLGYKGFFDVDDLTKIGKAEIKAAVGRSCALIVVLHNETWDSEWCRYEWEAAAELGIPVRVIVDCERCSKVKALEAVKPWPKLLEFQFLLFIESNRRECWWRNSIGSSGFTKQKRRCR